MSAQAVKRELSYFLIEMRHHDLFFTVYSCFQAATQLDAESLQEAEDYGSPINQKASMVLLDIFEHIEYQPHTVFLKPLLRRMWCCLTVPLWLRKFARQSGKLKSLFLGQAFSSWCITSLHLYACMLG